MSADSYIKFSLTVGQELGVRVAGATRYDIVVDGSINLVADVAGTDVVIGTVTDEAQNFYYANGYKLVALNTAVGTVTGVHNDRR